MKLHGLVLFIPDLITDVDIFLIFAVYVFSFHRGNVTRLEMEVLALPKKRFIATRIRLVATICITKARIIKQKIAVM